MSKKMNREEIMKQSNEIFTDVLDAIENASSMNLEGFNPEDTAIIVVDMVKGFAEKGALYSPRIESLIEPIKELLKKAKENKFTKLFIMENHEEDSIEFKIYPKHCVKDTQEAELVEEFKEYVADSNEIIYKNSTNGFLEKAFKKWLEKNLHIKNFILVGDCTDICVEYFAVTLKNYMNMENQECEIIVPTNAVDTFDVQGHPAAFMNVLGLFNMMRNGVKIIKEII